MKKYLKQKGFTLIEILIVVVILAILAALIVPRLLSQPEKAAISEGMSLLGVVKRAQINYMDVAGTDTLIDITTCSTAGDECTPDAKLGIKPFTPKAFGITCGGNAAAAGSCIATRLGSGDYAGNKITLVIKTGAITCGTEGTKKYAADTNPANPGCTLA